MGAMPPGSPPTKEDLATIEDVANRTPRDSGYTRGYYSYPAKFLAHLPRELIRRFTRPGNLVFDGYCGGGTAGLEAMLLRRRFLGYDLNPFAILISMVKTTRLDTHRLARYLDGIAHTTPLEAARILDWEDRGLLGSHPAAEVEGLASAIDDIEDAAYRDFFRLALIHSLKMVGRRDFGGYAPKSASRPGRSRGPKAASVGPSILTHFVSRTRRMILANASLPLAPAYPPEFVLGSSVKTQLPDSAVDVIITSPPYKDLDVEYMQLQFQRPHQHRSKRSDAIARILGVAPLDKATLCGGRDATYWDALRPSLREAKRVLRPGALAFWWIGFRDGGDRATFEGMLGDAAFETLRAIRVRLSHNRAASSRSTHHGRATGMLGHDYLFVTMGGG